MGVMVEWITPLFSGVPSACSRSVINVSQPVFAAMMNIPTVTAASWERGWRKPTGATLRLLDIARKHPEVLVAD